MTVGPGSSVDIAYELSRTSLVLVGMLIIAVPGAGAAELFSVSGNNPNIIDPDTGVPPSALDCDAFNLRTVEGGGSGYAVSADNGNITVKNSQ